MAFYVIENSIPSYYRIEKEAVGEDEHRECVITVHQVSLHMNIGFKCRCNQVHKA